MQSVHQPSVSTSDFLRFASRQSSDSSQLRSFVELHLRADSDWIFFFFVRSRRIGVSNFIANSGTFWSR